MIATVNRLLTLHSHRLSSSRKIVVAQLPYGFHRQRFAVEDDLAALLAFPVPELARDVHPADSLFAGSHVRLADDEPVIDRLDEPVVEMAFALHVEDFRSIPPACAQIRVAALELDVDFPPAWLAIVVPELYLAVDALIEHACRSEHLVRLAAGRHHVADKNLLQWLFIERYCHLLLNRHDCSGDRITFDMLLDEVDQKHPLVTLLAGDELFFPASSRLRTASRSETRLPHDVHTYSLSRVTLQA
jgi:hypothetical protein